MNFLTGMYVKVRNKFDAWKSEERGSQTLEWLGIAAVVVIVVGIVSQAFKPEIGNEVAKRFKEFIQNIGDGSAGG
jgi:hypothetical protein